MALSVPRPRRGRNNVTSGSSCGFWTWDTPATQVTRGQTREARACRASGAARRARIGHVRWGAAAQHTGRWPHPRSQRPAPLPLRAKLGSAHPCRRAQLQPGRRGQRRGRSLRCASVERWRRRFSSLARSRSSLSPTSRKIRSRAAPRPSVISAMARASPVDPPITAAQIAPATTSAAADPKLRTRARGATSPTYRGGLEAARY